jgi:nucleoside-diphosphate-sugar epimerase
MEKILVTGATGFLGSTIVANLLEKGRAASLLLLVRADNVEDGLTRIYEALHKQEVPENQISQIDPSQIILGEFGDVAAFTGDSRLDDVTHVINCAAIASFGTNPLIWPINVDGTFAFARRMARAPRLERFVHVGTAMACGPDVASPVGESWELAPSDEHLVQYTASKAEIERKLHNELPDLPLVVARPSIVVGHTRLGCKPSGSIFWVFRMARKLEQFTCTLDEKIDVIPVDYCAEALVMLALKPKLAHNLYHISAGEASSCTFGEIDTALAHGLGLEPIGNRFRKVSDDELKELAHEFQTRIGPCNRRLVLRALQLYAGFAKLNYVFDNHRLLAEGIPPSPRLDSYIGLCARTSVDIPVQEQMKWDFK